MPIAEDPARLLRAAAAFGAALAQTPAPRIVCAWCHPGAPPGDEIVSHGICPRHAAEQRMALTRRLT